MTHLFLCCCILTVFRHNKIVELEYISKSKAAATTNGEAKLDLENKEMVIKSQIMVFDAKLTSGRMTPKLYKTILLEAIPYDTKLALAAD